MRWGTSGRTQCHKKRWVRLGIVPGAWSTGAGLPGRAVAWVSPQASQGVKLRQEEQQVSLSRNSTCVKGSRGVR